MQLRIPLMMVIGMLLLSFTVYQDKDDKSGTFKVKKRPMVVVSPTAMNVL